MEKQDMKIKEIKPIELKPLKELKTLDTNDSNAFVCDLETGVCGPADKMKEEK